jgi:hypothetical protein
VKYRFETWITADEAVASRFRAYLTEHAGKDDGPPQTLMVRAWRSGQAGCHRSQFTHPPRVQMGQRVCHDQRECNRQGKCQRCRGDAAQTIRQARMDGSDETAQNRQMHEIDRKGQLSE